MLEPDRPGYVPSVSFLRPDRSEERGPLQIGIFDSASWQDSKQKSDGNAKKKRVNSSTLKNHKIDQNDERC